MLPMLFPIVDPFDKKRRKFIRGSYHNKKKNEELGGNITTSKTVTSVPSEQMYIHKDNISVQSLAVHHFCREWGRSGGITTRRSSFVGQM